MKVHARRPGWLGATVLGCAIALGAPASAHNVAEHSTSTSQKWPQASLNAEASASVLQDTVKVTLATELSAATQSAVAQALSQALEDVMVRAKKEARVKASSGNYHIWPMNDKSGNISNWRGRAEIFLESTDFAAASELAAALSDRMPIGNLAFSVSPQLRAQQEQALLGQAAQAFRDRALAVTQAFGYESYTVRELAVGGSGAQYQPAGRMMAMEAQKTSAPLEPGSEVITVSVQGSIFLQPTNK